MARATWTAWVAGARAAFLHRALASADRTRHLRVVFVAWRGASGGAVARAAGHQRSAIGYANAQLAARTLLAWRAATLRYRRECVSLARHEAVRDHATRRMVWEAWRRALLASRAAADAQARALTHRRHTLLRFVLRAWRVWLVKRAAAEARVRTIRAFRVRMLLRRLVRAVRGWHAQIRPALSAAATGVAYVAAARLCTLRAVLTAWRAAAIASARRRHITRLSSPRAGSRSPPPRPAPAPVTPTLPSPHRPAPARGLPARRPPSLPRRPATVAHVPPPPPPPPTRMVRAPAATAPRPLAPPHGLGAVRGARVAAGGPTTMTTVVVPPPRGRSGAPASVVVGKVLPGAAPRPAFRA